MRNMRIDFAPPSLGRSLLRTGAWTWVFGTAALLLCLATAITANELLNQRAALKAETHSLQNRLATRTAAKPEPKVITIPEVQAHAVNSAIAQLNLPWRDLLDAIEVATPTTVALLALDPDAKKQTLKGTAEAKSSDAMIAYIEQLKRQDFFDSVVLTKHEVNEQDPNKPLRFQFEVRWTEQPQ